MPFRRASASATPNSQSNSNPNSPASFAAALASASSPSTSQPSTSLEREQLQFQRLISFDQARRSFIQDQNNNQVSNRSNLKPTGSTSTQRRHSTPANQSQPHPDGFGGFSSSSVPQVASPSPMSPASDSQVSVMAKIGKKDKDRRKPSMSIGDDLPHFPTSQPSTVIQSTPHLPMAARALESNNQSRSSFRISPGAAPITTTTTTASDNYTALPAKCNTSTARRPSYKREDTPSLLHGDNAMLIDREISRLREKDGQKRKMSARVRAGVASLVVLGLSTYILAQYIISWLALSPGTYVGSDAASGTPVSPDPQLRTISLIAFAAAAASVAGCLGTIEYLRSSRRPSCGTYFTWFVAILSTTVQLGLACANLALIVIWHKLYTKPENSSNPLALTRDVGQRCQGNWDLDLLWSAAKYSSQSDDAQAHSCDKDPSKTTEMFLVVGGIRLGLFVVFCSIWLVLLGKYNKVLKEEAKLLREGGVTIEESAEMHKLLEDEEKLLDEKVTRDTPGGWNDSPQMKYVDEDDDRTLTHKAGRDYAEFVYEREIPGEEEEDEIDHLKEGNGSQIIVPPRLNRFDWQRGEPSTAGGVPMQSYQSVPHGDHENDLDHGRSYGHEAQRSEGWSAGIFSRVAEAVGWYSAVPTHEAEERAPRERMASQQEWEKEFYDRRPSNVNVHNPRSMPTPKHSGDSTSSLPQYSMSNVAPASSTSSHQQHQQLPPPPAPSSGAAHHQDSAHTRQGSKLGISAWFRRDASDSVDERDGSFAEPPPAAPQTQAASQSRIAPPPPPSSSTSSHRRSASQERRASESRHAASRQLNSQHNGARDRSESRERERQTQQHDRISFLAKSGGNDSSSNVQSPTSSSVSVGNDLPHMPALGSTSSKPQPPPKKSTYSSHGAHPEDEDGTDFWLQEGDVITRDSLSALPRDHPQREPTYVRTLGKLVRKLSAIESVGSGERASRRGLSDQSSPISPHENQLNVPNERRYNARSASSIGESFPGAWTKKF